MAAMMGARRVALTATGVGVAAGCLGTWFEMSHGVVCIPVLTLPPLGLSQQVAVGSTVFGVAARQVLSATLYALEPGSDLTDTAALHDLVDVNAAAVLAASGTVAAAASSVLAARIGQRPLRKANGVFCVAAAIFLQWRASFTVPQRDDDEQEEPLDGGSLPLPSPPQQEQTSGPVQAVDPRSASELARHLACGFGAGAMLGFFGIGPAWMLAPVLARTAPGWQGTQEWRPAPGSDALFRAAPSSVPTAAASQSSSSQPAYGPPGSSDREKRTCCLAMVPPSLIAAWRHFSLGHVVNAKGVALPLATGAIAGSALCGMQLADVPCEDDLKYAVSLLLFAYGCWSVVKG